LNLLQKLQFDFSAYFLHVASLYYFLSLFLKRKFILGNNPELGYDNNHPKSKHKNLCDKCYPACGTEYPHISLYCINCPHWLLSPRVLLLIVNEDVLVAEFRGP
jgi:hypothetical protein